MKVNVDGKAVEKMLNNYLNSHKVFGHEVEEFLAHYLEIDDQETLVTASMMLTDLFLKYIRGDADMIALLNETQTTEEEPLQISEWHEVASAYFKQKKKQQ